MSGCSQEELRQAAVEKKQGDNRIPVLGKDVDLMGDFKKAKDAIKAAPIYEIKMEPTRPGKEPGKNQLHRIWVDGKKSNVLGTKGQLQSFINIREHEAAVQVAVELEKAKQRMGNPPMTISAEKTQELKSGTEGTAPKCQE